MASNIYFRKSFFKKIYKEFFNIKTLTQYMKTIIIGLTAAVCDIFLYRFLNKSFDLWYIFSHCVGFFFGFWISFLLNRFWTFKSKDSFGKQLSSYTLLFFFNLGFSTAFIFVFTNILGVNKDFSKFITIGITSIWNFVIYKKVIYKWMRL